MAETDYPDEVLMSYVDGEVDAATAARIEAALREDNDLAARIELFGRTGALARKALAPLLDEPVPTALAELVESMIDRHRKASRRPAREKKVVALPLRQPSSQRALVPRWTIPLAASVALAIAAGAVGFWLGSRGPVPQMLALGPVGDVGLANALGTVASGGEEDVAGFGRLKAVSSFRDRASGLCRELELNRSAGDTLAFIACRRQNGWSTTFAVATSGDGDSYAPAGSTEALDVYLSAIEASPPLDATEEKQALDGLQHHH